MEPKITVVRGGPLLVEGPAPLVRLAKVDRGPGARPSWRPAEMIAAAGPYAVCRCGETSTPPFCDRDDRRCFDGGVLRRQPLPVTWTVDGLDPPALALKPDGPVRVLGPIVIADDDGPHAPAARCSLCRCGSSGATPYCDGTHKTVGFRDPLR